MQDVEPPVTTARESASRRGPHTVLRPPVYAYCDTVGGGVGRVVPQKGTLPGALKVHPRGFRLLSSKSPVERGLGSYFRLPPAVTKRHLREMGRVKQMLRLTGNDKLVQKKEKTLDGFALLKAAGVDDPGDAVEASFTGCNVTSVIEEDLTFFTNLQYLDLGENHVKIEDLTHLESLEELHLHCSRLETTNVADTAFPRLEALNLSFNNLTARSGLVHVSRLSSLSRLDLSGNKIDKIPRECVEGGGFENLHQLALEKNCFCGSEILAVLSTVPNLQEINLNYNKLTRFPSPPEDSDLPWFPSLQVISLAENDFSIFESLFPLTKCHELKRAVLWGNPISRRKTDTDIIVHELGKAGVMVYLEGPIPPKRTVGEFYIANRKNMVKVGEFKKAVEKEKKKEEKDDETYQGSAFFMTEPELGDGGKSRASGSDQQDTHEPPAWFSLDTDVDKESTAGGGLGATGVSGYDLWGGSATPTPEPGEHQSCKSAYTALKRALDNPLTAPIPTSLIRRGPRRKHRYALTNPLPPLG